MAETGIVLGYGGGVNLIDSDSLSDNWLFLTGGSLARNHTVPLFQPFGMPNNKDVRGPIALGKGKTTFSGNINIDFSNKALSLITNLSKRNKEYDIVIHDGRIGYKLPKCKFDSFSISASPQSLVTGTMSFQSVNLKEEDFTEYSGSVPYLFDDTSNNQLIKYWHTGETDVESFTFNWSQSISPSFLNNEADTPEYIRGGAITVTLSITAWREWLDHKSIKMGDRTIQINTGVKESMEFSYGGQSETGTHTYTFKGYSETDSGANFFTIT